MNPDRTDELVERSRQNDTDAFRQLVEAYQPPVFRLVFRMLCNEDDTKDVVQETFIRVWLHLHRYKSGLKFSTWVCKIACNLCCDRLRAVKRFRGNTGADGNLPETTDIPSGEDIEQSVINRELGGLIAGLTHDLTPKQKLVFTLRDIEGMELDDIKLITGLSGAKIKSNLYLARQYIRNRINSLT